MDCINLDSSDNAESDDVAITIMDSQDEEEGEIREPEISVLTTRTVAVATIGDGDVDGDGDDDGDCDDDDDNSVQVIPAVTRNAEEQQQQQVFVIEFHDEHAFDKFGNKILRTLQTLFENDTELLIQMESRTTAHNHNGHFIRAFQNVTNTNTNTNTRKIPRRRSPCKNTPPPVSYVDDHSRSSVAPAFNSDDATAQRKDDQRNSQSPDLSDLNLLFMIDTEPAKKLNTNIVPTYKRAIKEALHENPKRKKSNDDEQQCMRPCSCFNCGSNVHSLRDCPKQRNMKRILKAKKMHAIAKTGRYHTDIGQRLGHIRPGTVSESMHLALGLRKGQLPFFFYRMRVLGYPPGWLEDAKISHSGITIFDSSENDCDHEAIEAQDNKYVASKIVEFPGFNTDPGKNFVDEFLYHNVPPLSKNHSIDEFMKTFGDNIVKSYVRKRLKDTTTTSTPVTPSLSKETTDINAVVADMDIEDDRTAALNDGNIIFNRPPSSVSPSLSPSPSKLILTPALPAVVRSNHNVSTNMKHRSAPEQRCISPSLEDLEAQQAQLLMELRTNNVLAEQQTSVDDGSIDLVHNDTNGNAEERFMSAQISPEPTILQKGTVAIKESHVGTPILKFSPFDKLPASDKFKVGVSGVIGFENLPDSTGKYEQMKVVIKRVRKTITQLNCGDES